jgi:hypothetical protein
MHQGKLIVQRRNTKLYNEIAHVNSTLRWQSLEHKVSTVAMTLSITTFSIKGL